MLNVNCFLFCFLTIHVTAEPSQDITKLCMEKENTSALSSTERKRLQLRATFTANIENKNDSTRHVNASIYNCTIESWTHSLVKTITATNPMDLEKGIRDSIESRKFPSSPVSIECVFLHAASYFHDEEMKEPVMATYKIPYGFEFGCSRYDKSKPLVHVCSYAISPSNSEFKKLVAMNHSLCEWDLV